MNKKAVLAQAYFQDILDELSASDFNTLVNHLKNRHSLKLARSPGRKDVAKALAKHEDGASLLTGAIKEIERADEVLEELAQADAERALERIEEIEE